MSNRQKSFFDQDHKARYQKKSNWHRTRSAPDHAARYNETPPPKPTITGPPNMAATQSRTKLKAFQFIEGRPSSQRSADAPDKENETVPEPEKIVGDPEKVTSTRQMPALVQSKTCPPSTPRTRLPLVDLIGNTEDAARRRVRTNLSPEERILWAPNSSATPAGKTSKRARSSSPVSSSQNEVSAHFSANKETFDVQHLQDSLRTPRADPAADLWSRYAVNTNKGDTTTTLQLPTFAHLIDAPSPHSSAVSPGGSVGGLRRWASCGIEWPTSKTKRRKTAGAFRRDPDDECAELTEEPAAADGATKLSRVGLLIERIQETLVKPAASDVTMAPSSSSLLSETFAHHPAPPDSPLQKLVGVAGEVNEDSGTDDLQQSPIEPRIMDHEKSQQPMSSDFGGEDIDLETIQEIEQTNGVTRPEYQSRPTSACALNAEETQYHDASDVLAPEETIKEPLVVQEDDSDEFGGDDDLDVTDLENVVSLYDKRPDLSPTRSATAGSQEPQRGSPIEASSHPGQDCHVESGGSSDDEFGGDDIDDEQFAAAELAATQSYRASAASEQPHSQIRSRAIQRYLVKQVVAGQYMTEKGHKADEKVLIVEDESKNSKAITMRQSWCETHCTPGTYVHVIGSFTATGQCTIDDANNMLIVHPDHLISATVVADSFECTRRAVLQDRVKATSKANAPQVYGHILHEVFQGALKANRWDGEWLEKLIETTVTKFIESIYELGHSDTVEALGHLKSKMPELEAWARVFVRATPGSNAVVNDRHGKTVHMSVSKLLDVEEHVWSPTYGLKGNIDATVQVAMRDEQGDRTLTVPFEVKTGKNNSNASHRAQTALYTLLLSDRYDVEVAYGILYYLETSDISRIPAIRNELRHMVMQRNELACYVRERLQLPPMIQNPRKCGGCYAKTACFIYHKLAEDGTTESSGAKEKFKEVVRNLKPIHQEFFKKWDELLSKEESEMMKFRRELWTMLSSEREKLGRCFANVVIEAGSALETQQGGKINRFQYTLVKRKAPSGFSFTESQIAIGEPIVISDEKGHFALANGYVTNVRKRRITVAVDRRLHNSRIKQPGFDALRNQAFAGIMSVDGTHSLPSPEHSTDGTLEETLYRLDKDEFSNGMALVRNNLVQIMDDNNYRAFKLRSLIVENTAPIFKPSPTAYDLSGPQSQLEINSDQRVAIEKVMAAQDYALVLGMPGTGKTTTIAHIIRALVAKGKSVLLTSYTHTAVDNILLKIRKDDIRILRLGAIAKVHPEVEEFAELAGQPRSTIEELEDMYMNPQVVATTCLGINHAIFSRRIFDYCIVDEASQITLPVCLGPIRMARTFILVGDHFQLPPIVQNKRAQEGGLDVSLFKSLSEKHPQSVVSLEHQYRMCEEIMLLSNQLIYGGRLKCGNEATATRRLHVPNLDGLRRHHSPSNTPQLHPSSVPMCPGPASGLCWLATLLAPSRAVVFANTDALIPRALETAHGARIINAVEAALTTHLVTALLATGIAAKDIGVITLYRSQLALLRQNLYHLPVDIEMHTADKFQGRDKEVVVLSMVRSNEQRNVGELLKDWRRVNVAFTRARSKLIVIGSKNTLVGNELLERFVQLVDERGWRVDLPAGATEGHVWDSAGTQAEGTQISPLKGRRSPVKGGGSPKKKSTPNNRNSPTKKSSPLSPVRADKVKKGTGTKIAGKSGSVGKKMLLGRRGVLRDIVNEALGEEFVD